MFRSSTLQVSHFFVLFLLILFFLFLLSLLLFRSSKRTSRFLFLLRGSIKRIGRLDFFLLLFFLSKRITRFLFLNRMLIRFFFNLLFDRN